MTTPTESDDVVHLGRFVMDAEHWPESDHIRVAFGLLGYVTNLRHEFPIVNTFANDLGGTAALARVSMQMRAAYTLAAHGFEAEVRALLRSAYEGAGLARVIAKDLKMADDWLRKGRYFPDSAVRRWIRDVRQDPKATLKGFRDFYEEYSAWAHPTAKSCLALIEIGHEAYKLNTAITYSEERSRSLLSEIAIVGLFACFAWRNAVVDETVLHPQWRKDLYQLAETMAGESMPHLERDWAEENRRHEVMLAKLRQSSDANEVLRQDPNSWHNLRPEESGILGIRPSRGESG